MNPFPTRRTLVGLTFAFVAFAAYASLLPFEFVRLPVRAAFAAFRVLMLGTVPRHLSRTDVLANLLLFVPIGFCAAGALLLDARLRVTRVMGAAAVVLPAAVALSLSLEFLQLFTRGRVTSPLDVAAQVAGTVTGIAIWSAIGQRATDGIRKGAVRGRDDRLARLLAFYAAAWAIVNLAPFDVTLDLGELSGRVHRGLITLRPFGPPGLPFSRIAWDAFIGAASAVPVGVLALIAGADVATRRPAARAFALGASAVLALETAQVFIGSHAADTGDVLFGWVGIATGVWIGSRQLAHRVLRRHDDGASVLSPAAAGAVAAWIAVLCVYHWMPFDFTPSGSAIRQKLGAVSLVPFAAYHAGSDLGALNQLLVKLGLAVPLGVGAAFVFRGHVWTRGPARLAAGWLAGFFVVFTALEAGQLLLPTRYPDPTDVMVGVAGAAMGLWLARWLSGPGPRGGHRQLPR